MISYLIGYSKMDLFGFIQRFTRGNPSWPCKAGVFIIMNNQHKLEFHFIGLFFFLAYWYHTHSGVVVVHMVGPTTMVGEEWCHIGKHVFQEIIYIHDDVIKWKHFPHYWPFVSRIHWWSVDSPHKGQWRGTSMFSLICAEQPVEQNDRDVSDLRCYCTHYDVNVMIKTIINTKLYVGCIPGIEFGQRR